MATTVPQMAAPRHRPTPTRPPQRRSSTTSHDLAIAHPFGRTTSTKLHRRSDGNTSARETPSSLVRDVLGTPGQALGEATRAFFEPRFGQDLGEVRIHTDNMAFESARAVNALAYTVGNDIVFGQAQYSPNTMAGQRLLAHELAHTVQQRGAAMPATGDLAIAAPDDVHERQAEQVADIVMAANDGEATELPMAALETSPLQVARVQRVVSFTTTPGTFNTNAMVVNEDAAGFVLGSPAPTFQWTPNATIHGAPTDVFSDWEVAHHQVGKVFQYDIFWGTGANRTHRRLRINGGLPMRDATAAANTWYHDPFAQGFAANGDVGSPVIRDTPSSGRIPWTNPVAGRVGTRGWFSFSVGFVSTLSASHIPDGTNEAAFRHLNHVHWNSSVTGTFDTTAAVGGRVTLNGGAVNRSRSIPGFDVDNRPMHGGAIINNSFQTTDT
ncbi:DUF4157 domain-containing protein [Sphingomonas sp. BIUV-7]|uniref:DUF4157 domain-containing protein n=1 Tax=Sphingomonas natans TaxID=3063330 RepID=A0ABT8YEB9_9SPHN|nr:DUF4157 domain-containing protein [Sphingomonas sp. BIUV-7]MDO6416128.1 DUF4157 domain-containing protein [Sphingomonas sp. BIUV-7]